jgi:HEPN domain-containing protein
MDEAKRDLVRAWFIKARNDLTAVQLLSTIADAPLDIAIYHCQQAAEKAVKGYLVYHGRHFERTHDVGRLVEAALEYDASFSELTEAASILTPYAVAFRYPDESTDVEPSRAKFDEALRTATDLMAFVLARLPDEVRPDA